MSDKYSGADWIKRQLDHDNKKMSDFGIDVADIIGQAWKGIYHIQKAVLNDRVQWGDDRYIRVVIPGGLETYDFDVLTKLVVLCFDRMVRLEIDAAARNYLALAFTHRYTRENGDWSKRLPYLEDHIKTIREDIGLPIKDSND